MLELFRREVREVNWDFPHHYADLCSQVCSLHNLHYKMFLRVVKRLAEPLRGNLLDAGCGDGRFCYELRDENVDVNGVDCNEKAIRFARAFNPDMKFYHQNLRTLSIPRRFNIITMMETLEHIHPEDICEVLAHLYEHLYDDGKLIVTVPSQNLPVSPEHYQHFTFSSLEKTLHDIFDVKEIIGYSRGGFERGVFEFMRRMGVLAFPVLRKFPKAEMAYTGFLEKYYGEHLEVGEPDLCNGLIAVCGKR